MMDFLEVSYILILKYGYENISTYIQILVDI